MTFTHLIDAAEELAAYNAASQLIHIITINLATERRHYRTIDGQLLTTLDGVLNAILNNTLSLEIYHDRNYRSYPRRTRVGKRKTRFDRSKLDFKLPAQGGQRTANTGCGVDNRHRSWLR